MRAQSFVDKNVVELQQYLEKYLADIDKVRAREDREAEEQFLASYNNRWWRRLLKKPAKTELTNKDKLWMARSDFSPCQYHYPSSYAYGSKDVGETLLRACKQASGPTVLLHVEDMNMVGL